MATRYFQGVTLPDSEYVDGIEGVKVTIDVVPNPTPVFVSLGMNLESGADGVMWGQVGYIQEITNRGEVYMAPFYQVWNGTSLLIDQTNFKTKLVGEITFEFSNLRGDKWAFYVDGKKIGTVDMGDNEVTGPTSSGSSFTGTEYSSPIVNTINFSDYSVKTDGAWHIVSDTFWFTSGTISPPDSPTGAVGNLQDPSIPDGSWSMGRDLPAIEEGTQLWSSEDDAAFSFAALDSQLLLGHHDFGIH